MQTVLDRNTIENAEKEKHNAMIKERYRKLFDAVEDQFSAPVEEYTPVENAYTPVLERPAVAVEDTSALAQTPTVTEYRPSALASSLFTTEKFNRLTEEKPATREVSAPVAVAPVTAVKTASEVGYSLTPLAKIAMAVFTFVVVAMLVLIGVNSQTIQSKRVKIQNLEEKKQELMEKNEDIQRRIQELQTDDSVIERAIQAGLGGLIK